MSEIITEDFRKSLRSSPTGKRKNGTIFDELYCSLETSENPLDRAVQTIAEFHGPWSGGSSELTDFSSFVASRLNSKEVKKESINVATKTHSVNNAINSLPKSSINKYNSEVCAIMPTPLLREFLNRSQKLHPSINMYIQMHIGSFPYFQQISEDVGQFANIVLSRTSVDPMKWSKPNGVNCLDTNSRMNKNTYLKMNNNIFSLMDNASNLVDTLFLRSLPKNNMPFIHPNYAEESPIAHGHNYTMDVFNAQRNIESIGSCVAVVISLAQDLLRLVNKFFCIEELVRYEVEGFNISMNEGPNGEAVTYIVDNSNRPMFDNSKSTFITDPTNDKVLGTKREHKDEKS